LVDEISPKLSTRTSGYLRIEKSTNRRGDNAEMAVISFVDDLKEAPVAKSATTEKPATKPKAEAPKKATTVKKPVAKKSTAKEKK